MKKRTIIALILLIFLTSITVKQKIATSKFNLKVIEVENNFLLNNEDVKKLLSPFYETNLFFLDYREIEKELKKNSFIESFKIKKKYPDALKVKIYEKKPIAILFNKKKKFYLSEKIDLIEFSSYQRHENLPYVFGSQKEFKIFYNNLKKINFPLNLIKKYTLFQSSRWDLETVNNNLIKLPSSNYLKSLDNYLYLINKNNFQKYKVFDYRIKNQLILK